MSKFLNLSKYELNKYLENEDLLILYNLKTYYDDKYYNSGDTEIEDWRYDSLKDIIIKRDPLYKNSIGCDIRINDKSVKLPFHLGSSDKISPTDPFDIFKKENIPKIKKELNLTDENKDKINNKLQDLWNNILIDTEKSDIFKLYENKSNDFDNIKIKKWKNNNLSSKYVISEKLDGVSGLFSVNNGTYSLFTRGNGSIGKDISHIIKYINNLPKNIVENIYVRGELIIKKDIFNEKYKDKNIDGKITNKSIRNTVAGRINGKKARDGIQDIDFVAYEIVDNNPNILSEQLKYLKTLNFEVVKYKYIDTNILNIQNLKKIHTNFKNQSIYDIDGIIIHKNTLYDRNISGNPSYMLAFKMSSLNSIYTTTVKHIEWNVSKWNRIIPVVVFEPIYLPDATLQRATQNNARYIVDKKLGPGSVITVIRSKEVIPYIVNVIKSTESQLPDIPYKWDDNNTHIIVDENNISKDISNQSSIKRISTFFKNMKIDYISISTIEKLYNAGFNDLFKIINIKISELLTIPTIKQKSAERIFNNIKKGFSNIDIPFTIGSSGVLGCGIGIKRVEELFRLYPDILKDFDSNKLSDIEEKILSIEGFSNIITKQIIKNLPDVKKLIGNFNNNNITFKSKEIINNDMVNMKIIFTGFRDKNLEENIIKRGGKITSSISKNTSFVIVKDESYEITDKIKKSQNINIPILTKNEFVKKYF
jgi:DNA ligase (NAD+)